MNYFTYLCPYTFHFIKTPIHGFQQKIKTEVALIKISFEALFSFLVLSFLNIVAFFFIEILVKCQAKNN